MPKATDKQIADIIGILMSGVVSTGEADAFIVRFGRRLEKPAAIGPSVSYDEIVGSRLRFFEERYPACCHDLMELLGPFYDWRPELRPADDALIRSGIAYDGMRGPRIFRRSEETDLWTCKTSEAVASDMRARTYHIDRPYACDMEGIERTLTDAFSASPMFGLPSRILTPLIRALICSCSSLMGTDCPVSHHAPFFRLWLFGNYPLGLDAENRVLILVAD